MEIKTEILKWNLESKLKNGFIIFIIQTKFKHLKSTYFFKSFKEYASNPVYDLNCDYISMIESKNDKEEIIPCFFIKLNEL